MQNIMVTTPTGNVGRHVARLVVQAGARPRLLARDASRIDAGLAESCDVVEADQLDRDAVLAATRGVDALFWVDPGDLEDPRAAHERAGGHVAAAVREHGIGRVVFQSSGGAELRDGAGEIDGLGATEAALDATDAAVCHLRCGFFFTNLLQEPLDGGVLQTTWPTDKAIPWVDPRDIAAVAAARLLHASWDGRVLQGVHGPEDLSFERAAETIAAVTGRPLRAERISDDEQRERLRGAGLPDAMVEAIVGMAAGLRGDDYVPEVLRSAATTTPTSLAAWAAEHLR